MAKIKLVALAVITLGVAEVRDSQGRVTQPSTLRQIQPGEPFDLDEAADAEELRKIGAARDPIVEEASASATSTASKGGRRKSASQVGTGLAGGGEDGGQGAGTGHEGAGLGGGTEGGDPAAASNGGVGDGDATGGAGLGA